MAERIARNTVEVVAPRDTKSLLKRTSCAARSTIESKTEARRDMFSLYHTTRNHTNHAFKFNIKQNITPVHTHKKPRKNTKSTTGGTNTKFSQSRSKFAFYTDMFILACENTPNLPHPPTRHVTHLRRCPALLR